MVIEKNNLENEVNVLQSQVESLLLDKELYATQLETKTKELEQKETDLQEIQARLDTLTNEVESLEEEILSLGVQLEEKNQEIENLNITINSLNQTLANRNAQIEELQERLRIASEASGITYKSSYYEFIGINIPEDSFISQSWNYSYTSTNTLLDYLHAPECFSIFNDDVIDIVYKDELFSYNFTNFGIGDFTTLFSHNGTSMSSAECLEYLNSLQSNNQTICSFKFLLSCVNGEYILNIDFVDYILTGKFVSDNGSSINFDTGEFSFCSPSDNLIFMLYTKHVGGYEFILYDLLSNQIPASGDFEFIDDNSFKLDGMTFYRENTEQNTDESNSGNDSTENSDSSDSSLILEAPHSLNVSMEVMGQDDTKSYYLKFENGTGFLRITNLADASDIQEITLEFVSWDSDNSSSIIFKRTDTNEEIELHVEAYNTTGNIETGTSYKIVEAIYKGVRLTFESV